jgi:glutamate-1-semialdehyde 2,1-aminomutase
MPEERYVSDMPEKRDALGGEVFDRGRALGARARQLIPGGCHTYAKGDDQFPERAPGFIVRGEGCRVWDLDGNQFIEYGMGLRAVTLGHAYPSVLRAVRRQLECGTNFGRPAPIEVECAETFLSLVPTMDMVKFCKDGSTAVDGAVRLARAHTRRDVIAICQDHPFFSTSDWFIGSTAMPAGITDAVRQQVVKFPYNDLVAIERLFADHPGQIACVILEAARTVEPQPGFLEGLQAACRRHGAVLVFDEMITGFRWHRSGAHGLYGVTPDLATFGKALGNGFAVSAIAGRRELMELGGIEHDRERVFLLSTTHGAETHALAAAIATMQVYESEPVTDHLHRQGDRLREGIERAIDAHRVRGHFACVGRDCCLLFATMDAEGRPSQTYRTLFMQELIRRGVLAPSFVVSYSHTDHDIDLTIAAVHEALAVYRLALENGPERFLVGSAVKPVFRPYA